MKMSLAAILLSFVMFALGFWCGRWSRPMMEPWNYLNKVMDAYDGQRALIIVDQRNQAPGKAVWWDTKLPNHAQASEVMRVLEKK